MSLTPENEALFQRIWAEDAQSFPRSFFRSLNRLMDACRAEGEANAGVKAQIKPTMEAWYRSCEDRRPSTGDGDVAGLEGIIDHLHAGRDIYLKTYNGEVGNDLYVPYDLREALLSALSAPTKGDVAGLVEQLWDIVNARDDAEHGFPDWVRNPCMAAALALSAPTKSDELRKALEDVAKAAANMPRRTPAPGGAATEHAFTISAAKVWELDRALTALSTLQAKEAGR